MAEPDVPSYSPFAPGFADDPYPAYDELRRANPVEANPLGFWTLWRHRDVAALLRGRLSVESRNLAALGPMAQAYERVTDELAGGAEPGESMLDRDPPDHDRLRRLVSQAFTPRRVQDLGGRIDRLVSGALDRIDDLGTADIVEELAFPLPFAVISAMLGMPDDVDVARIRELSGQVVRSLEPAPDEATVRAVVAAELELEARIADVVAWKRAHPGDDLLTDLVAAEDAGAVLSDAELVAQVVLLYVAGHETTVNLIGNGTLALLRHPDQLAAWRADPGLDGNAVEELLRYDSPVQMSGRITLADYDVDGRTVPAGRFVVASLASANRDPERFGPDAASVRLDRPEARHHVSFGAGVHHCLGASLARLEGRAALGGLVRRFPAITLTGEPVRNGRINLRGLTSLPVGVR